MGIPNYEDIISALRDGLTVEAREKLMQLREAAMALQEENLALRERLHALELDWELMRDMRFDRGVYWVDRPTADGSNHEGPFCQVCHDKDRRAVRLHSHSAPGGGWFCAVCRNHF